MNYENKLDIELLKEDFNKKFEKVKDQLDPKIISYCDYLNYLYDGIEDKESRSNTLQVALQCLVDVLEDTDKPNIDFIEEIINYSYLTLSNLHNYKTWKRKRVIDMILKSL